MLYSAKNLFDVLCTCTRLLQCENARWAQQKAGSSSTVRIYSVLVLAVSRRVGNMNESRISLQPTACVVRTRCTQHQAGGDGFRIIMFSSRASGVLYMAHQRAEMNHDRVVCRDVSRAADKTLKPWCVAVE